MTLRAWDDGHFGDQAWYRGALHCGWLYQQRVAACQERYQCESQQQYL